jgi:hypothetical protein
MRKILLLFLLAVAACSSGPQPKDTVFEFIDAVKSNDSVRVAQLLDIDAYVKAQMVEMSSADSAQILNEYRGRVIRSLLNDGDIRRRWMNSLIVVNKETKQNDRAEVEVSFVDQQAGHQLYTRVQLEKQPDGTWRIVYFS